MIADFSRASAAVAGPAQEEYDKAIEKKKWKERGPRRAKSATPRRPLPPRDEQPVMSPSPRAYGSHDTDDRKSRIPALLFGAEKAC